MNGQRNGLTKKGRTERQTETDGERERQVGRRTDGRMQTEKRGVLHNVTLKVIYAAAVDRMTSVN